VNSAQAVHGVTPRAASHLPRRYINFIVETPFKAFRVPKLGPGRAPDPLAADARRKPARGCGRPVLASQHCPRDAALRYKAGKVIRSASIRSASAKTITIRWIVRRVRLLEFIILFP
jgi:hypothetical protein